MEAIKKAHERERAGDGNGAPRDDDDFRRRVEEAHKEFDDIDDDDPLPGPEPEDEPASQAPTSDAAEGTGDGSFSHIWRSKDYDYPCTPIGKEQRGSDGRIYVPVKGQDGSQTSVPKDELVLKSEVKPEPEPEPEPKPKPKPKRKPKPTTRDEEAKLLDELNRDNCVVLDGGKVLVLRFEKTEHEAGGERYVYFVPTFLTFRALRNLYLNRGIWVGDEKKPSWIDLGSWWLQHPRRREYLRGLIFRPGDDRREIDGCLNLWTGWGVTPKRGDWSLLRKHLREVLAAGDEEIDRYNYNWLAWSVQNPGQQATAALVFIGDPGTGKGTLGNAMCRIFGQHSLHISSAEDLTGKFNDHLRQCCFLFGDECYAPQDRRAEGQTSA